MAKTVILSLTRKQSQVRLDVVQYTTAPDIVFIIEDYTPTGRADFYIEKPSGEEIYNHCTIDGNKIIFTPTTQCFAEVGEQKAQLQILDGDKMAVSFPIQLVVAENIIDSSAAESQSEFTELQDAISTIGQYDQRIQDVQDDMAALETQLTDDMAALQTNVTQQLNTAISGVNTQITNINTELDALENNVQNLNDYGFIYRRQLTSADDLNNITTMGTYYYLTDNVPANAYYNNASILEVIWVGSDSYRIIQRLTRFGTGGKSAFRIRGAQAWSDWAEYSTTAELTALSNVAVKKTTSGGATIVDEANTEFNIGPALINGNMTVNGNQLILGGQEIRDVLNVRRYAIFEHRNIDEAGSITSIDIAQRLPALGGGNFNGSASIPDISISSGSTTTEIGNITLQRGTYLLFVFVAWTSNATGRRYINIADAPGASTGLYNWLRDSNNAVNGSVTTNRIVAPIRLEGTTRLFINGLQNSGSALTASTRWCAVRIDSV